MSESSEEGRTLSAGDRFLKCYCYFIVSLLTRQKLLFFPCIYSYGGSFTELYMNSRSGCGPLGARLCSISYL